MTERGWFFWSSALALGIHVAVALLVPRHSITAAPPAAAIVMEVDPSPPSPPPPPAASTHEYAPAARATPAAPSPAQAAKVVTSEPRADEPVDLTGAFTTGNATTYAGGTTSAFGTATHAVMREATAAAAPRGTGASAGSGVDRSRSAKMSGDASWTCPFPSEADDVNDAVVTLRVRVDARGAVLGADVVRDPGHGFGREAARCVRDKRWDAALDRDGSPLAATTLVNVRFVR